METMKIISFLLYLICICGLYFQVHLTSVEYFNYQVTTRISIKNVEKFIPPDFSVCYWLDYIINAKNIETLTGKDISNCSYHDIECMLWFYNHSMESIIHKFTYDLAPRLTKVVFETAEGKAPNLKTYYRYQHKCIRIGFGRREITRNEMAHISLDFGLYWINLDVANPNNQTKFQNPFIIIHEAGKLADIAGTRGIRLDLIKSNSYIFKYKLIRELKLGAPYDDCFNYQNWKHSKPRAIEECLTREYLKINRTNLARTTWELNFTILDELRVLSYGGIKYFEPKPGVTALREYCGRVSRSRCDVQQYFPSVLSATRASWVAEQKAYLEVQANEPITEMASLAYFPLLDYFTYLISMPGAWIGLSVSSLLLSAFDLVSYIKRLYSEI